MENEIATYKPDDVLLWLDLETTGSDTARTDILEVGIALVRKDDFSIPHRSASVNNVWGLGPDDIEAATFTATFRPVDLKLWTIDPAVIEMHAKNGLWRDIINGDPAEPFLRYDDLDAYIIDWLNTWVPSTKHIALAGSGVSHFDRPIIRRLLPRLDKRLTYYAYDVGVIRRFLRDFVSQNYVDFRHTTVPHRALPDVKHQIEEAWHYRRIFWQLP